VWGIQVMRLDSQPTTPSEGGSTWRGFGYNWVIWLLQPPPIWSSLQERICEIGWGPLAM